MGSWQGIYIRTISSLQLLSALMNRFGLVYWQFGLAKYTWFLPRPARKDLTLNESNLPITRLKEYLRFYCLIYILWVLASFRCKLTLATLNDSMSRATKVSQQQPHLHSELCTWSIQWFTSILWILLRMFVFLNVERC